MTLQYEVYGSVIKVETLQVLFYELSDVIQILFEFQFKEMATTTTTTTTSGPTLGISIDRGYMNTLFGKFNLLVLVSIVFLL